MSPAHSMKATRPARPSGPMRTADEGALRGNQRFKHAPQRSPLGLECPSSPGALLGLDPATACGFAHSCGISGVWDLSVRRDESSGMRLIRLRGKLDELKRNVGVDLLAFEAQRGGRAGRLGALVVQSEIQSVIKVWCHDNGVEYRGFSPAEVKKAAGCKGNCGKAEVIAAAKRQFPHVTIADDNHADALFVLKALTDSLSMQPCAKEAM